MNLLRTSLMTVALLAGFAGQTYAQNDNILVTNQKYHDAAMFNAPNGNPRYIDDFSDGRVAFTKDGMVDKANSSLLSIYKKYDIKRNDAGYPILLTTDYTEEKMEYDSLGHIKTRIVKGTDKSYTVRYGRHAESIETVVNGRVESTSKSFDDIKRDYMGNWKSLGTKGVKIPETHVFRTYATAGDVVGRVDRETVYNTYGGGTSDYRTITYWPHFTDMFKHSDSPNEFDIKDIMQNPFFIDGIYDYKTAKQKLKEAGINFREGKLSKVIRRDYFAQHSKYIIVRSSKTFYGLPVRLSFCKDSHGCDYRVDVLCKGPKQQKELMRFLAEELSEDTLNFKLLGSLDEYEFDMIVDSYKENEVRFHCLHPKYISEPIEFSITKAWEQDDYSKPMREYVSIRQYLSPRYLGHEEKK